MDGINCILTVWMLVALDLMCSRIEHTISSLDLLTYGL